MHLRTILPLLLTLPLSSADWVGTWTDGTVTLTLAGTPAALTGILAQAGQNFPVTAVEKESSLTGSFTATGSEFIFTAEIQEGLLIMSTDGTTYQLKRQTANPLAKPANPLAKPATPAVTAPAATPAGDPLVGTWRSADEVVELLADGSARIGGGAARWRAAAGKLVFTTTLGELALPYRLAGDVLTVETEGETSTYRRVGGIPATPATATAAVGVPATAPADGAVTAEALVGVWLGPEGACVLKADGSGKAKGKDFRWGLQAGMLQLASQEGSVGVPVRFQAGKLILGTGPTVECERAVGVIGCWSGWDGHVDPTIAMSITHRIALRADGTVEYAKGEMDATRARGWFTYRREQGGQAPAGRWRQEGAAVQFNLGSGTYTAVFDEARQVLTVRGMGQVNEGANVEFTRE